MKTFVIMSILSLFFNCNGSAQKNAESKNVPKIIKTDEQWKTELTPEQYYVLRKAGTERPFSSPLNNNHEKGTYVCVACGTPLFLSEHKFDSGTGWPSFDREIKGNVNYSSGGSSFYGIEEHCAVCGGHLGHIFNDGPRNTTGKRHCINGVALKFVPSEQIPKN